MYHFTLQTTSKNHMEQFKESCFLDAVHKKLPFSSLSNTIDQTFSVFYGHSLVFKSVDICYI